MKEPKQIVYRYNGDEKSDEEDLDILGDAEVPAQGTIIMRKGKPRKAVSIQKEETVVGPRALPIYRVYLSDQY
jgi:hypothetical protein